MAVHDKLARFGTELAVTTNGVPEEVERQVLPFRPRGEQTGRYPLPLEPPTEEPVSDLAKLERSGAQDDYRHRMFINLVAMGFTGLLIVAGIWLAMSLVTLRKDQDCVLMGLRSCAAVDGPAAERWSGHGGR
jgi:hypothetical protein